MASVTATELAENAMTVQADEDLSLVEQDMIEGRLATLSDRITLCNRVLGDLRNLIVVLEKKSLQDVSLPQPK